MPNNTTANSRRKYRKLEWKGWRSTNTVTDTQGREGWDERPGEKVWITCKKRWMMEASRRDGLRYSEERTTEKEWMKKQKKVVNTGQIKEHELTWRNKVKLRRKREGRLWKTVGEIGGRNWRGKGGKKTSKSFSFLVRQHVGNWTLTRLVCVRDKVLDLCTECLHLLLHGGFVGTVCVCVCVCRPMCAQFPGVIVNCQSGVPPTEIYWCGTKFTTVLSTSSLFTHPSSSQPSWWTKVSQLPFTDQHTHTHTHAGERWACQLECSVVDSGLAC